MMGMKGGEEVGIDRLLNVREQVSRQRVRGET